MKTKEAALSFRVPENVYSKLKSIASHNRTTVSEIARDTLMKDLFSSEGSDHEFFSKAAWVKAVKEYHEYKCDECRKTEPKLVVRFKTPAYQGGKQTISNGRVLCEKCDTIKKIEDNQVPEYINGIPEEWHARLKTAIYNRAKLTGEFDEDSYWRLHLACFYTKRKSIISPVVKKYVETYLKEVDIEVIKKTLFSECPTPELINFYPPNWPNSKKIDFDSFPKPTFLT